VSGTILEMENKSHILLIHRNSSNGYYGGYLSLFSELNYIETVNFIKLTDDYYHHEKENKDENRS
jgi:hypothetical protein